MSNFKRYDPCIHKALPDMCENYGGVWVKFDDIKEFLKPAHNTDYMAALVKIKKIIHGRGDTVTKVGKVSDLIASLNFPKAENCT